MLLFRALHILTDSIPAAGLVANAWSYAPLLRKTATKSPVLAEDLLILMANAGVAPTEEIVSSLVETLRPSDAVSTAQHLFNQHRVRPTRAAFHGAVAKFIEMRNLPELRRASSVYRQLWPSETEYLEQLSKSSDFPWL